MAPKGASFLYATKDVQKWLDPLVVRWGYNPDPGFGSGNSFIDYHEWQGTRDIAAFLTVPAAIEFMAANRWDHVRNECHQLALQTRQRIQNLTGLPPICPESAGWFHQMFATPLPDIDLEVLKKRLYAEYQIEIPMIQWNGQKFIRVSIQGYNTPQDLDSLVYALSEILDA